MSLVQESAVAQQTQITVEAIQHTFCMCLCVFSELLVLSCVFTGDMLRANDMYNTASQYMSCQDLLPGSSLYKCLMLI